jgi:hypothetical protein
VGVVVMDTDAMRAWVETYYPDGNHLTVLYLDALADLDAVRADRLERGRALADLLALLDEHECVDPAVERARALVGHIERKVS